MALVPARKQLPRFTDRLELGRSGLTVSPFCLGLTRDPDTFLAAYDAGINFFFLTADMHWPVYEPVRQGLVRLFAHRPSAREDVVVGVVTYVAQPEFLELPFTETIEAVEGLGRVDVAIAGGAYSWDIRTRLAVFRAHCEQGFAGMRAFGASFHDRAAARQAVEQRALDIAFIRYNPGHTGAREDVFPFVGHRAPTLLFNFKTTAAYVDPEPHHTSALDRTHWVPSRADHYRFALSRPQLDGLLVALSSPKQVDALASAIEEGGLDPPEEDHLIALAGKR